jgi:hypothetical protein
MILVIVFSTLLLDKLNAVQASVSKEAEKKEIK